MAKAKEAAGMGLVKAKEVLGMGLAARWRRAGTRVRASACELRYTSTGTSIGYNTYRIRGYTLSQKKIH